MQEEEFIQLEYLVKTCLANCILSGSRSELVVDKYRVTAYWIINTIRIDIKGMERKT